MLNPVDVVLYSSNIIFANAIRAQQHPLQLSNLLRHGIIICWSLPY